MKANSCKNNGFEDLIVSYIYDEASAGDRSRLEGHILDCSSCMDEFAGLSNARLSVFEWQKEAFSELETPMFIVPAVAKPVQSQPEPGESFIERVQALIAGLRGPVMGFAAVLLAVAAGLVFVLLRSSEPAGQQIAANVPAPIAEEKLIAPAPAVRPVGTEKAPLKTTAAIEAPNADETSNVVTKAVVRPRPARPGRQLTAKLEKPRRIQAPGRKAPVLSDFDDSVDDSLRLSDLFDGGVSSIY